MIPINKGAAPRTYLQELEEYRRQNGSLPNWDREIRSKRTVVESLVSEQRGICAYCMSRITVENAHVEHILPQSQCHHGEDLDYGNMLAVCDGGEGIGRKGLHCDRARGDKELHVNPLKPETLAEIRYMSNGKIKSKDPAIDADLNQTLNLNGDFTHLVENRKAVIDELNSRLRRVAKRGGVNAAQSYCKQELRKLQSVDGESHSPYVGVLMYFLERRANR